MPSESIQEGIIHATLRKTEPTVHELLDYEQVGNVLSQLASEARVRGITEVVRYFSSREGDPPFSEVYYNRGGPQPRFKRRQAHVSRRIMSKLKTCFSNLPQTRTFTPATYF